MKLIFIYGPPASGKLTTAKELSKITDFPVYHNHLAHDLVDSIFDYKKHDSFFPMIAEVNLFMLEKAFRENLPGLIFTNCYVHPKYAAYVKNILRISKKYGGKNYFVQLVCGESELLKRVAKKSRQKYGKLKDPKKLKNVLENYELFQKIPFIQSLSIGNTRLSAKKTARKIKEFYGL